jgi:VWFA-related protein
MPFAVQAAATRQFLLLFDLRFSPRGKIPLARKAALRFLRESMSPGDLVAVATYGRQGLKMLTSLTSDRDYVGRAIQGLGLAASPEGAADPLDLSGAFDADTSGNPLVAGSASTDLDGELAAEADLMRASLRQAYWARTMDFLGALEDLGEALSSLGGRKQVVLLSGGFSDRWQDVSDVSNSPIWQRMADLFRGAGRSDMVIHSIDLSGLAPPPGSNLSGISSGPPVAVGPGSGSWAWRPNPGRATLAALAENTGGRYVYPTNDFGRALNEVDAISRRYYILAFQPAEAGTKPDRERKLRVRVSGSGLKVSHRASYVLPASAASPGTSAQHLRAAESLAKGLSGGALGLHLLTLPYRSREGGASVPAVLHVDGSTLASPGQGGRLDVEVYGYAMAAGRVVDRMARTVSIDLEKQGPALRSDGLRVLTTFAVPTGPLDLRFFVRVGNSGPTGSIRQAVDVKPFVDERLSVSPPMLKLPLDGRIVAPGDSQRGPGLEIPFRLGNDPFVPDSIRLETGRASELCVFVWRAVERLEVTGQIVRQGEAARPLGIESVPRVVPDDDGFERYLVTVVPPEASAGDYTLRLTFREPGTTRSAYAETAIRIED